jgi:TonB-dependent starch-binding outer membrane protein SusC
MRLILTRFFASGRNQSKRLRLILHFFFLISLIAVVNVTASVYSTSNAISVQVENVKLRDLFREIENNSDYAFFFNDQYAELDKEVSLAIQNEKIDKILNALLEDTGLDYQMLDNNFIVIVPKTSMQELTVAGTITDANGSPLPGVNVIEKGTTNGVITDLDGKYSISITSTESILQFSFVGYLTEEIPVGTQTTIDITLIESLEELGEVVVIGYGVLRKEAVTGSVATMEGDVMRDVPSANITQSLKGRMPGVEMLSTSSKPGAELQIRIRGTRSLSADNDPLVVLDGIPFSGSLGDINPNDIKSVDILKDASATAIYGSRGANGVILLTTNKGQKGQEAVISYNGYYGFKKAIPYPMMDGPEFVALRQAAGRYVANGEDEFDDVNTDWQDLFYRTAQVTSHDISVIGGTEKSSYNFGFGYYLDQAVIPTSQYQRISLRAGIDQELGKFIKVGFTSNNNFNLTEGSQIGMYGILSTTPIVDPYEADGSFKRTVKMNADETWIYPRDVLNDLGEKWLDEKRAYGTYNNIYGELKIPGVEGLKYRINVGLNYRKNNDGAFTGEGINSTNPTNLNNASITNKDKTYWIIENLLTYDRTFADKHQVNLVGLYSAEQTKYTESHVSAKSIPNEDFLWYNLGQADGEITVNPNDQDYWLSGLKSWMGRAMYSYDNRYMLTATVRSDGSSRLAEGQKWHTYPAVSAGWNIGNEPFMNNVASINMLKLRVGYGQTSNQAVDPYATLGLLDTRPYNFGDTYAAGYYVSAINNPIGWEYSETMNYGLDFTLLKYRLSGTFEYYVTNTKDILLQVDLPRTSGVESFTGNIGETQNKGWEFSLDAVILDNQNGWSWDLGFNVYANHNKIVALAAGVDQDVLNGWFVGYPINAVYDYEKIGIFQESDSLILSKLISGGRPGMIRVKYTGEYDEEGLPVRRIGPDDRQIMSVDPDFQGGFNTRVAYKGVDLNIVGAFKSGGMIISTLYGSSGYLNMHSGRRNNVKIDYWTPENTGAKYPDPSGIYSGDNPAYAQTLGYFKASYLKIHTISLGYSLKQQWANKVGIKNMRLYLTVQNAFVMLSPYHKESGMDPEPNSYGNENAAVTSVYNRRILTVGANTPNTRNYLIGMNLTF